jgi:hypothetical protein
LVGLGGSWRTLYTKNVRAVLSLVVCCCTPICSDENHAYEKLYSAY